MFEFIDKLNILKGFFENHYGIDDLYRIPILHCRKENKLNFKERESIIRAYFEKVCMPILTAKGKASAGATSNPNANFEKGVIEKRDMDKYDVWYIYYIKQYVRFESYMINRKAFGEKLNEMIVDMINYLFILVSMKVNDGELDFDGNPYPYDKPVKRKHGLEIIDDEVKGIIIDEKELSDIEKKQLDAIFDNHNSIFTEQKIHQIRNYLNERFGK